MAQNSSLEGMARVLAKHTSSEEKKAVEDILHILTFYWDHPIKVRGPGSWPPRHD